MKRFIFVALLLSTNAMAVTIPNFECVEIHGMKIELLKEHGRFDSTQPVGYGSFVYPLINNAEANVVNAKNSDGYYYGNVYLDNTGNYYYDIKCKLIP